MLKNVLFNVRVAIKCKFVLNAKRIGILMKKNKIAYAMWDI
jgi:hypothetical protein